jgi:hypothetical protein
MHAFITHRDLILHAPQGHNLIQEGNMALDMKDWGTLAYTYGGTITNERAVILVGHLHLVFVSICVRQWPRYPSKWFNSKTIIHVL